MRKNSALTLIALLALTFALAAVGCGKKSEETTTTPETTTPSTSAMPESSMAESSMTDTTMHR